MAKYPLQLFPSHFWSFTKEQYLEILNELEKLQPNWDQYGAEPVSPKIITYARSLVDKLPLLPNHISPLNSGELQLEYDGYPFADKYPHQIQESYTEFEIRESGIFMYTEAITDGLSSIIKEEEISEFEMCLYLNMYSR